MRAIVTLVIEHDGKESTAMLAHRAAQMIYNMDCVDNVHTELIQELDERGNLKPVRALDADIREG